MKNHSCKTLLCFWSDFNGQKNAEFIKQGKRPTPEDLDIVNKDEIGRKLSEITDQIVWNRHHFEVGSNEEYDVDVNNMIRKTLSAFTGKEDFLKEIQKEFGITVSLEIIPRIAYSSDKPRQILSLDDDIIAFLYKAGVSMDLDYYIY